MERGRGGERRGGVGDPRARGRRGGPAALLRNRGRVRGGARRRRPREGGTPFPPHSIFDIERRLRTDAIIVIHS